MAGVTTALVVWETLGSGSTGRLLISRPSLVAEYAHGHALELARAFAYTAVEASLGMLAAILFSLLFALAAVFVPRITALVYPGLVASQVIPFVCLAPLVILVFGPGPGGKIFLSALMSFFPVITNLLAGMKAVPRPALELMRMMDATRMMTIRHVYVPYALGYYFAGIRVAAPLSVIGAIVAEFNGAAHGIGKDIFISAKRLEPELMMIGIISGSVLSALLFLTTVAGESALGDWYRRKGG